MQSMHACNLMCANRTPHNARRPWSPSPPPPAVAVSIIVGGHSATCLCSNGTRLVLEGIDSANSTFEGVNTTFRAGEG